MIIQVPTPDGFNFEAVVRSHGWAQLDPFSIPESINALERIHQLNSGDVLHLRFRPGESGLEVEIEDRHPHTEDMTDEVEKMARTIFQLDMELAPFYALLDGRPRYTWVEPTGAGRLLRSPTVWEDLVKTLMTTNIAWAATRKIVERITALGDKHHTGRHTFPVPSRIASQAPETLAKQVRAGYRTQYLHELATHIAAGELDVEGWADADVPADELYDRIRSLNGFGPYASGVVLKLLGRHGRLSLDTSARSMFQAEFRPDGNFNDHDIEEHYREFGGWSGLVLWMDLLRPYMIEGR